MKVTRGILNNNPANIRKGCNWKGLADKSTLKRVDSSFCQFVSIEYGVRALICLLRTYSYKYKLTTVHDIILRFAPPSDGNCTCEYIDKVSSALDVRRSENLSIFYGRHIQLPFTLFRLCRAICQIESGYILNECVFQRALDLL